MADHKISCPLFRGGRQILYPFDGLHAGEAIRWGGRYCKINNKLVKFRPIFRPLSPVVNVLPLYHTQNPGSSAYTRNWVLYTWDKLIMSISQVGKPLHEFEEDLSRSYLM